MLAVLLFAGCSKDSVPTETPLVPGTSTIITGTVKDSSGNPIDSAAIKVKYYFTAVAKHSAKTDPCSLESFTAIRTSNGVQLQWVTLSELNLLQWRIYRSIVADSNYTIMASMPGYGTSPDTQTYSYFDSSSVVVNQTYYYRLGAVSNTGSVTYYGPIQVGPLPIYNDVFNSASPCPFSGNTAFVYSLACSSQVLLAIKQKDQTVRTLVNQLFVTGLHSVMWDGKDDYSASLASGYFTSELTFTRHDSIVRYSKPVFINIVDSASSRVNSYSDAQGAFTISDLPIDSVFKMTDVMGTDLGNVKVCDSVTVYAVKNGYTANKVTFVLGKNTTSTIDFILR